MSSPFSKKFCGKNPVKMSPFNQGGYEGGGDIEGKYYIPTGQMYADMFAKIGQAVADIDKTVQKNKKKKEEDKKKEESMFNPDGTLKKSASERANEIISG